jgi:hypothetical protein
LVRAIVVLLLLALVGRAFDPVPAIYRNAPDFYGAVGSSVTVAYSLSTPTASVGTSVVLMVNIRNVRNPGDITRPPLDAMPAWTTQFQIESGPTTIGKNEVWFQYTLRPRVAGKVTLPRIRFSFFNPAAADGKQLQTAYSDTAPLSVTEATASPRPAIPIPERFRSPATEASTIGFGNRWAWLVLIPVTLGSIPLITALVRRFTIRRRERAIALATARVRQRLQAARHSATPAEAIESAVREYVAVRPERNGEPVETLLTACHIARFSPNGETGHALIPQADRIVGDAERVV